MIWRFVWKANFLHRLAPAVRIQPKQLIVPLILLMNDSKMLR